MPLKRSSVSSQFKDILEKIRRGELAEVGDAAEIAWARQRRENIRVWCENCDNDTIGVATASRSRAMP
jgi:hypothetical protein